MELQLQEIQSIYISQNRLVEGKDYVRAEWLTGEGSFPLNASFVEAVGNFVKVGNTHPRIFTVMTQTAGEQSAYFNSDYDYFTIGGNNYMYDELVFTGGSFELIFTDSRFTLNNTSTTKLIDSITSFEFSRNTNNNLKVSKIRTLTISLTPCQLLRSIPASLDANGIARTAGECGMVDSVSGKFYGNVASSGSFSVEGLDESGTVEDTRLHQIYTNKLVEGTDYVLGEMLKSAGSWIDTKLKDFSTAEYMEIEVKKTPTKGAAVFGCEAPSNTNRLILTLDYYENKDRFIMYISTNVNSRNNYSQGVVNINFNTKKVTLAGGTYTASFIPTTLQNTFPLFAKKANNGTATIANEAANLCISYFKVDGLINLVPCQLLRPIPRNLDAQCKPRVAGECGMIDLISGRFYGNVAESGTFRLAWDEWLKDCSIQITIPSCYAFNYTTRVDTTKLTSELVDFGIIKLSNTQIVYGDEDDGAVYTVDWGTNKWATLDILIFYTYGNVQLTVNGTLIGTISQAPLNPNPHIYLHDIMQIKQIYWTDTQVTTTLTRYVDETTGQQGLISDQDGTIIYAD